MGGALYHEMGSVSITNCHFVGNSADNGGVLYSYKASVFLISINLLTVQQLMEESSFPTMAAFLQWTLTSLTVMEPPREV